jgi:hypothetical protein
MLLPSEIQRVEVFVGMEMPTNLGVAAGTSVAAAVVGTAVAVGPQALKNTESTRSIEMMNISFFFIFFFSFRTLVNRGDYEQPNQWLGIPENR